MSLRENGRVRLCARVRPPARVGAPHVRAARRRAAFPLAAASCQADAAPWPPDPLRPALRPPPIPSFAGRRRTFRRRAGRSMRFATELLASRATAPTGCPSRSRRSRPSRRPTRGPGHRPQGLRRRGRERAGRGGLDATLAERALRPQDALRGRRACSRPERTSVAVALRALATQLAGDVALVVVTLDGRDGSIGSIVGALAADDCRRAEHAPLRALACAEASASLAATPSLLFLIDFASNGPSRWCGCLLRAGRALTRRSCRRRRARLDAARAHRAGRGRGRAARDLAPGTGSAPCVRGWGLCACVFVCSLRDRAAPPRHPRPGRRWRRWRRM